MDRRKLLVSLAAAFGGLIFGWTNAETALRPRPRARVRGRLRRRYRRRVIRRMVGGRPVWVVPVGLAVGWELVDGGRVVVVKEMKIVERDSGKAEVVVVQGGDGKTEEIEIVREDTKENREELEGSVLPEDDTTTPGMDLDK